MRSPLPPSSRTLRPLTYLVFALALLAGICSTVVPAAAQPPAGTILNEGSLKVSIDQNSATAGKATVAIGSATLRAAFAVENPSRIVLDIAGLKLQRNRTLNVSPTALIQAIRVGVHKEIVRVVIDCQSEKPPQFEVQGKSGKLKVVLTALGQTAPGQTLPAQPAPEKTTAEALQPTATAAAVDSLATGLPPPATLSPQEQASSASVVSSGETAPTETSVGKEVASSPAQAPAVVALAGASSAALDNAGAPTQSSSAAPSIPEFQAAALIQNPNEHVPPAPTSQASTADPTALIKQHLPTIPAETDSLISAASQLVQGISFEPAQTELPPTIRIIASKRGEFKLAKADDRGFELTLPGYGLADSRLALPQFPTDEFMGITFVQAESTAQGVKIRIGVDRGTRLSAVWRDNQITVTTR